MHDFVKKVAKVSSRVAEFIADAAVKGVWNVTLEYVK